MQLLKVIIYYIVIEIIVKVDINIYKIINDIYINFKVKKVKLTNAWFIG